MSAHGPPGMPPSPPPGWSPRPAPVPSSGLTGTALLAVACTVLAAVVSVVNGVLVLVNGRSMLEDIVVDVVRDQFGEDTAATLDPSVFDSEAQTALDNAYDILQTRAIIWITVAVLAIGFVIPMYFGMNWARITLTAVLPVGSIWLIVNVVDAMPAISTTLAGVSLGLTALAILMYWLPPTNSYMRWRRDRRRPPPPGAYPGLPVSGTGW